MAWLGAVGATLLIALVLVDTFEAMILPRRIAHAFRPARLYYRSAWALWRWLARRLPDGKWRLGFMSVFGPASVFVLFFGWAAGLIFGFAALHWSLDLSLTSPREETIGFGTYFYFSGTTFLTLGYGDLVPLGPLGRALSVVEAGLGFGFLAVVISFLPVLYQSFSRREIVISLLDARAGSPPTAVELLRRAVDDGQLADLRPVLVEWERWAAELLESHLSYPTLRFYRSQHDNQSWIAALTTILDTTALLVAVVDGGDKYQARLTFAMARHAAVDLSLVSQTPPLPLPEDRLPPHELAQLRDRLAAAGLPTRDAAEALAELRSLYEPFVHALADYFEFPLPRFSPPKPPVDNWQTSAWTKRSRGIDRLSGETEIDHFTER